jgi:hypothetical protein
MSSHIWLPRVATIALLATGIWQASGPAAAQELKVAPPPAGADIELEGNAEVLTRGPVHEAFAEAYSQDAESPLEVIRQPPEPIEELPPDVMPEGEDVEWIPGYWGWDDERDDFIWISGVWRDIPPGQRWVPGSWMASEGGFQWSAGFWTSADVQEVTYLPEPPESQEAGPASPAPDDNHFWVPGTWRFVNSDYAWQPGFWAPAHEHWMWVPSRYVWTPYGAIYCDGYWDYDIAHLGVLFSPVYFPDYRYPRYVPQNVVSIGPMLVHLFVRPRYHHYYFGDYYNDAYVQFGIVPWLGVRQFGFYRYDPLFAYYQTGFFNGRGGFLGRISGWHHYYRQHADQRPRHTLADALIFARDRGDRAENIVRQASLTQSLDDLRQAQDRDFELRDVAEPQRHRIVERSRELQQLQRTRAERGDRDTDRQQVDRKLTLPRVERRDVGISENREREAVPVRPDKDGGRSRRVARPEVLDESAGRDRSPGEERERERSRSPRGRSRMVFPDAPNERAQDVTPIPRPSEIRPQPSGGEGARERRSSPRPSQEGRSPRPQEQAVPAPSADQPSGNRRNPPSSNRGDSGVRRGSPPGDSDSPRPGSRSPENSNRSESGSSRGEGEREGGNRRP